MYSGKKGFFILELPGTSLRSGGKGKKRGTLCTEILKFHRIAHILFFWSRLGRGVGGLLYFWPVRHPSYKNLLNLKYETGSYFLKHWNKIYSSPTQFSLQFTVYYQSFLNYSWKPTNLQFIVLEFMLQFGALSIVQYSIFDFCLQIVI